MAALAPAHEGASARHVGCVKFFNTQKGYGFIIPDTPLEPSNPEVFVHHTAILAAGFRSLGEGEVVEFEVFRGPKGLQASNVTGVGGGPVWGDPKVSARGPVPARTTYYFTPDGRVLHPSPQPTPVYYPSAMQTYQPNPGMYSPGSSPGSPPIIAGSPTIGVFAVPHNGLMRDWGLLLPSPMRPESPGSPHSPFVEIPAQRFAPRQPGGPMGMLGPAAQLGMLGTAPEYQTRAYFDAAPRSPTAVPMYAFAVPPTTWNGLGRPHPHPASYFSTRPGLISPESMAGDPPFDDAAATEPLGAVEKKDGD